MNWHQAKAVCALLERAAELAKVPVAKCHLGAGSKLITATVNDEDEFHDGSVEATIWRGGRGALIQIGHDGTLYDYDEYGFETPEVELAIREDGTFTTEAKTS